MNCQEGDKVEVLDTRYNKWFTGRILWIDRIDEHGNPDAWTVQLTNGNRGSFDKEHTRKGKQIKVNCARGARK